jgi:hypothetical protein
MNTSLNEVEVVKANNVVLNDKVINEIKQKKTDVLVRLENERKDWESGAYKTSNKQLYTILTQCMAYGGTMDIASARQRSNQLEKFYEERKYRYKKDSPLMTRVVRAVFGDIDRRRLSTYSLVLREAQRQNVLPLKLADWIDANGGIQEIRLSQSATFVGQKERVAAGSVELVKRKNLAVVKTTELEALADAGYVGTACVLLAEQQADGSFAVKQLMRGSGVVNAALAALYMEGGTAKANKQVEQAAANDTAKEQAISAATATAQLAA